MTPGTIHLEPEATHGQPVIKVGTSRTAYSGDRPPLFVPRDELFFWTRKWQAGEAESEREREAGNTVEFTTAADLIDWLRDDED